MKRTLLNLTHAAWEQPALLDVAIELGLLTDDIAIPGQLYAAFDAMAEALQERESTLDRTVLIHSGAPRSPAARPPANTSRA